jgi:hypothetical protein
LRAISTNAALPPSKSVISFASEAAPRYRATPIQPTCRQSRASGCTASGTPNSYVR